MPEDKRSENREKMLVVQTEIESILAGIEELNKI